MEKLVLLFKGEISIPKREIWMLAGLTFFAGLAYGLMKAPWTHGVNIGSHNGCNNEMGDVGDIGLTEKEKGEK